MAPQSNTTVPVAVGPSGAGAEADGVAAVNQTAQGIWQLQDRLPVRLRGHPAAAAGDAVQHETLQALGGAGGADATGPSAVDTVIRIVWQLQIGCLFWCYDAVEGQTASGTDSTVVVTLGPAPGPTSPPAPLPTSSPGGDPVDAQPAAADTPADAPPIAPGPAAPPNLTPPPAPPLTVGARVSGGSGVLGAALGLAEPGAVHPVLHGIAVTTGSVSAGTRRGESLLSVSATRSVALESSRSTTRPARHHARHPRAAHQMPEAAHTPAGAARRSAERTSALTVPWAALALALVAALALIAGLRRRFGTR